MTFHLPGGGRERDPGVLTIPPGRFASVNAVVCAVRLPDRHVFTRRDACVYAFRPANPGCVTLGPPPERR